MQARLAACDQLRGAFHLGGEAVHIHLFAAEAGEDFLDLGDRLGVGRLFFLCHISRGLTTVSHRALTVQP